MRMMLGREASAAAAAAWTIVDRARDSAKAAKARVVKVVLMGIRGVRVVACHGSWVPGLWPWRRGIPTAETRFQEIPEMPRKPSTTSGNSFRSPGRDARDAPRRPPVRLDGPLR